MKSITDNTVPPARHIPVTGIHTENARQIAASDFIKSTQSTKTAIAAPKDQSLISYFSPPITTLVPVKIGAAFPLGTVFLSPFGRVHDQSSAP